MQLLLMLHLPLLPGQHGLATDSGIERDEGFVN